jgi:TatD DNase family protein
MIIDSHCHLNHLKLEGIEGGLDAVIQNAKIAGVDKIISICVELEENETLRGFSKRYENVFHSVGVHPSEWGGEQPDVARLVELSSNAKCVAIGETGLDYHYNDVLTIPAQTEKFANHIQASIQTQKPLIIHTRAAKQNTLELMKSESADNTCGVMHCFTEDWDMAKQSLDMGFYISFSGIVTFKNADDLREVAKKMPLDRILIETDAPYLTPAPFRGKPNYPEYVRFVAAFMADLKDLSLEEFSAITVQNTERLFSLTI